MPTLKPPSPRAIAAQLAVPDRVLLFWLASDTDWTRAGVTHAAVRHMMARNLVDRELAGSRYVLTALGRAVLHVLVRPPVNEQNGC